MRRGAALSTSLRTGYISRDAVSDGLRNRFLADARNDSEDPLFQILRFAQNDNVLLLRMTMQTMLGMTMQSYVEAFPGIV